MACETFEQDVSGAFYVTTQWDATKQMVMKLKLINTFGDALFEMLSILTNDTKSSEKQDASGDKLNAIKLALDALFKKANPEEVVHLLKSVLTSGHTKREGKRITEDNFDTIYNDAGIKEAYMAFIFVVKSNYSDFFKGQKAGELLAKVENQL